MSTISLQLVCLALAQIPSGPLQSSTRGRGTPAPAAAAIRGGARSQSPDPLFDRPRSGSARATASDITRGQASPTTRTGQAFRERSDIRNPVSRDLAEQLIDQALGRGLPETDGRETALVEILRQNAGRVQRTRAVKSYWQLSAAIGEYRFAQDEEQLLAGAAGPTRIIDKVLLDAAVAAAAARKQEAKVAVLTRQHRLVEEASLPVLSELPWPSDEPLVGAYRTKFKNLFAGQPQSIRLYQIDRSLPHLLTRIQAHATAVSATELALRNVFKAYQQGRAELTMLLDIHENLIRQRRQFLTAVLDYNAQIVDYAVTVAGQSTPPDILVATLIATSAAPATAATFIRRTSAEEPIKSEPGQPVFREVQPTPLSERFTDPRLGNTDGTDSVLRRGIRITR